MKHVLFTLLGSSILLSCTNNASSVKAIETDTSTLQVSVVDYVEDYDNPATVQEGDTIKINYQQNKDLLEILKIIPDKSMESWEWDKADRTNMVEDVKSYNYFIDTDKSYNNIVTIKPHFIKIQVVDGTWIMAIYPIGIEHFMVVTDDMVGGGNDLSFYEFKRGKLTEIEKTPFETSLINDFLGDKDNKECVRLLEDNLLFFKYDFEHKDRITIKSFLEEDTHCLKWKTLIYRFNPEKKIFELDKGF